MTGSATFGQWNGERACFKRNVLPSQLKLFTSAEAGFKRKRHHLPIVGVNQAMEMDYSNLNN